MKTILHTVDIDASPDEVFQALTSEEGLAGWWTTEVAAVDQKGGVVEFTFLEGFNPHMEIVERDAPNRLVWTCVAGHVPWADNTFEFRLEDRGGKTCLFFEQKYAKELSDEEYGRYNFNWGYYLQSLCELCEAGEGKPFEP